MVSTAATRICSVPAPSLTGRPRRNSLTTRSILMPARSAAADALAWALYADGQYDEARRFADEALRLGTPYGSFLYHAGMIARAQGDTDAARDFLSRALESDPYFSPLYAPSAAQALEELGGS